MAADITTYRPVAFGADAAAIVEALRSGGFDAAAPVPSTIEVLDTFDGRIAAAGLRLTLVDERRIVLAGGDSVPASVEVDSRPRIADDLPPGPLRQRLADLLEPRVLLPVVTVTSQRSELTKRNGTGKVTAIVNVHEQPSAGGTVLDGVVAEVGELTGYARHAADARSVLEAAGLEPAAADLVELGAEKAGVSLRGTDVPVAIPLDPDQPAIEGFRAVLANLRDAIVVNWDGTVADVDPEFLHDLRVAVRRSRVVLANAGRVIPEVRRARAREELAWLGEVTGSARDLDVYQLEWPEYTADLDDSATAALAPLRAHLGELRAAAHDELAIHLGSLRARVNLAAWNDWLDSPLVDADLEDRSLEPLLRTVRRRTRRAHRRLIEHGRAITPATPAEVVHELRKDAKKLRYLVECFGGLYERSARSAFVSRLKALQDTLGAHQDAEVHAAALRQLADDPGRGWSNDTLLAIGQLVERLEHVRLRSRRELAERFGAFDRKETRQALKALLFGAEDSS
jgi:CHAD domain-containing protein